MTWTPLSTLHTGPIGGSDGHIYQPLCNWWRVKSQGIWLYQSKIANKLLPELSREKFTKKTFSLSNDNEYKKRRYLWPAGRQLCPVAVYCPHGRITNSFFTTLDFLSKVNPESSTLNGNTIFNTKLLIWSSLSLAFSPLTPTFILMKVMISWNLDANYCIQPSSQS